MKFEAGTPMIAQVIGLGKAIDYVSKVGIERIEKWEQDLLTHATRTVQEIKDLRIIGTAANKGAIISFVIEGIHPLDLGTMLDLRGIAIRTGHHCDQPTMRHFNIPATARISFALYNTKKEIDCFAEALQDISEMLK
jgi:cysteine desulfurase/selenocysteine lyase